MVDTIARATSLGEASPGDFAIMYRTNAQSRRIEEAFVRAGMPYRLVGATRFYGRREVKDVIAFLRLVHNPADSVSLLRVINLPPRGIGAKTILSLQEWAEKESLSLGAALEGIALGSSAESGRGHPFGGRAAKALTRFANLLAGWTMRRDTTPVVELLDLILEESGYRRYLRDGTQEGDDRWENVIELRNVAAEFEELALTEFLEQVSLVSDVDNLAKGGNAPTLLTLHSAKGLEFPTVFIVGVEEGILPHRHSWDDLDQMSEERRLFYVGITRAENQLYLLHCFRRSSWGNTEYAQRSRFLDDIPPSLTSGHGEQAREVEWSWSGARASRDLPQPAGQGEIERQKSPPTEPSYTTGQRVRHATFGEGIVIDSEPAGGDTIVTVAFEELGLKRLMSGIAKLQVIDE